MLRSLPLENIHLRHPVFSPATAIADLEAARVCLSCHVPPQVFDVEDDHQSEEIDVNWESADDRAQRAWGKSKQEQAIERGACLCAIAAVELRRQLFAMDFALKGSHVDYYLLPQKVYVAPEDAEDLEEAWGLEVSGTMCGRTVVKQRLRQKLNQARKDKGLQPRLACVVGFKAMMIVMATV